MPVGTYIVASERLAPELVRSLVPSQSAVCDTNFVLDYFRTTADDRVLFAGRVSYSTLAHQPRRKHARAHAAHLPATRAHPGRVRLGRLRRHLTMNRAPDFGRLADLGAGKDFANVYYLQGFSGHGLARTGLAGKLVAEAIAGDASRLDLFSRLRHPSLDANDKMTLKLIDRLVARAEVMGGGTSGVPAIQPVMIDGEEHFVFVMHPWCEYDLRTDAGTGGWLDIQKALATADGKASPICKGGLGMHNNVILHKHKGVIRFSDYGAGSVAAARNLFMGRQAGVVASGSPGTGLRFDWKEEVEDRGNQVVITTATIFGVKKSRFTVEGNAYDFGVIAADAACADPS